MRNFEIGKIIYSKWQYKGTYDDGQNKPSLYR